MNCLKFAAALCAAIGISGSAFAGEWHADRLRGTVLVMVEDDWATLARGDVVDESWNIRTGANGWVTFRSGNQTLEMQPNSQIQIASHEERDHTWVLHSGGEITADVEARDVEHFGVRTHDMVAVVKGTRFTVTSGEEGGSVSVERGTVAVRENERGLSVAINAGQRASGGSGRLQVDGEGELPVVVDAAGRPVVTTPPAQSARPQSAAPGNSANAPGRAADQPGNSANAPGQSGSTPGNSGNAPGRSGDAPVNSAPERPGNSASSGNGNANGNGNGNAASNGSNNAGGNGNGNGNAGGNSNAGGNGNGNGSGRGNGNGSN